MTSRSQGNTLSQGRVVPYCKRNYASTVSAERPFQTPKKAVVCTGFAVRADFPEQEGRGLRPRPLVLPLCLRQELRLVPAYGKGVWYMVVVKTL